MEILQVVVYQLKYWRINMGNFEGMERKMRFPLTKEQYKLWEQFVTDNYETIYSNKDTHEVRHTPHSFVYWITVERNEQSGMQEFLENLLAI